MQSDVAPMTEGAAEHRKITYVPKRNKNTDCFKGRGTEFILTKNMY
jgi:hypothetical protein